MNYCPICGCVLNERNTGKIQVKSGKIKSRDNRVI